MKVTKLRWRYYRKSGGPRGLGRRCPDYGPGCLSCEMYRYLDEHGRFPTWDEAHAIADAILDNPPWRIQSHVSGGVTGDSASSEAAKPLASSRPNQPERIEPKLNAGRARS